jgi:hypothetical protein
MKNYDIIYKEAWKEYEVRKTLDYFTNEKIPNSLNMTTHVLEVRDQYGSNLPMVCVVTPSSVQNNYNGLVRVRESLVHFPEKSAKPFG